jgi:hypothetical protein
VCVGGVKLTDFGASKPFSNAAQTGAVCVETVGLQCVCVGGGVEWLGVGGRWGKGVRVSSNAGQTGRCCEQMNVDACSGCQH